MNPCPPDGYMLTRYMTSDDLLAVLLFLAGIGAIAIAFFAAMIWLMDR